MPSACRVTWADVPELTVARELVPRISLAELPGDGLIRGVGESSRAAYEIPQPIWGRNGRGDAATFAAVCKFVDTPSRPGRLA